MNGKTTLNQKTFKVTFWKKTKVSNYDRLGLDKFLESVKKNGVTKQQRVMHEMIIIKLCSIVSKINDYCAAKKVLALINKKGGC